MNALMLQSVILHFGALKVWGGSEYYYPNRSRVTLAILPQELQDEYI